MGFNFQKIFSFTAWSTAGVGGLSPSDTPVLAGDDAITTLTTATKEYVLTISNYSTLNALAGAVWSDLATTIGTISRSGNTITVIIPIGYEGEVSVSIGFTQGSGTHTKSFGAKIATASLGVTATPTLSGETTILEGTEQVYTISNYNAELSYTRTASEGNLTHSGASMLWVSSSTNIPRTASISVTATEIGKLPTTATLEITTAPSNVIPTSALSKIPAMYAPFRLQNSYTGLDVRVERTSDLATQDFGFTANGLRDIAGIATFLSGGAGAFLGMYNQKDGTYTAFPVKVAVDLTKTSGLDCNLSNGLLTRNASKGVLGMQATPVSATATTGLIRVPLKSFNFNSTAGQPVKGLEILSMVSPDNAYRSTIADTNYGTASNIRSTPVFVGSSNSVFASFGLGGNTSLSVFRSPQSAAEQHVTIRDQATKVDRIKERSLIVSSMQLTRKYVDGVSTIDEARLWFEGTDNVTRSDGTNLVGSVAKTQNDTWNSGQLIIGASATNSGMTNFTSFCPCVYFGHIESDGSLTELERQTINRGLGRLLNGLEGIVPPSELVGVSVFDAIDFNEWTSSGSYTSRKGGLSFTYNISGDMPSYFDATPLPLKVTVASGAITAVNFPATYPTSLMGTLVGGLSGTYTQTASATATGNITAHGLAVNDWVYMKPTGGQPAGVYKVLSVTANTFTYDTTASATASGNLTIFVLKFTTTVGSGYQIAPIVVSEKVTGFEVKAGGTGATTSTTVKLTLGGWNMKPDWLFNSVEPFSGLRGLKTQTNMSTAAWFKSQANTFIQNWREGTVITLHEMDSAGHGDNMLNGIQHALSLGTSDPSTFPLTRATNLGTPPVDESFATGGKDHQGVAFYACIAFVIDVLGATRDIGLGAVTAPEDSNGKYTFKTCSSMGQFVKTAPENRPLVQTKVYGSPTSITAGASLDLAFWALLGIFPTCPESVAYNGVGYQKMNQPMMMSVPQVHVATWKNNYNWNASDSDAVKFNNARIGDTTVNTIPLSGSHIYNLHLNYGFKKGNASSFVPANGSMFQNRNDYWNYFGTRFNILFFNKKFSQPSVSWIKHNLDKFIPQLRVV